MQAYFTQIRKGIPCSYKLFLLAATWFFVSCEKKFAPVGFTEEAVVVCSIVSVIQNSSASEAVIEIKSPSDNKDFKIELLDKSGSVVSLKEGSKEVVGRFDLTTFSVSQLVAGEVYTVRLSFEDEQRNKITTSRNFTARRAANWKKLPHAPITAGDFTGAALLSPLFNSQRVVYRYQDEAKWDILRFDGKWTSTESTLPVPRHNAIAFPLGQAGGRELVFVGFGYIGDEKIPGKKAYLNDFWWLPSISYVGQSAGVILPSFTGLDRDLKFFLTYDKAFMLKEDFTGAMESMEVTWDRKDCSPLPEKTGKLAAFTVNEKGYVINQLAGQSVHVYGYDPVRDQWERKADFPGRARVQGTGFSAKGKGYFGLGVDKDGNGLRDLWEYDPAVNTWTFHSEYPGEGNRYLISFSDKTKAYLGWGYETRPVNGLSAKQQIGCTDFWEFNP